MAQGLFANFTHNINKISGNQLISNLLDDKSNLNKLI